MQRLATPAAAEARGSAGTPDEAAATLTFSQTAAPNGEVQFAVQAAHKLPLQSGSSSASFKSFEAMAKWGGSVVDLLPADFRRKR
jgi:hypothetical protein